MIDQQILLDNQDAFTQDNTNTQISNARDPPKQCSYVKEDHFMSITLNA